MGKLGREIKSGIRGHLHIRLVIDVLCNPADSESHTTVRSNVGETHKLEQAVVNYETHAGHLFEGQYESAHFVLDKVITLHVSSLNDNASSFIQSSICIYWLNLTCVC